MQFLTKLIQTQKRQYKWNIYCLHRLIIFPFFARYTISSCDYFFYYNMAMSDELTLMPSIIFMRNIKISFEHPSYIYPFKLNITSPSVNEVDRLSCRAAEEALNKYRQHIILSPEEEKVLSSLSVLFKAEFVNQYNHKLNQRKQFDFLGNSSSQHYQYFAQLCKERVSVKEMLELNHYIMRIPKTRTKQQNFVWEEWLNLVILFHTNFITGQRIAPDRQAIHQQLEAFIALYVLIESINQLVVSDLSFSMPLRSMLPAIQDSITQGYLTLTNLLLQEQALMMMLMLARSMLQYLKERLSIDQNNPQHKETSNGKKVPPSLIFWIINFVPQAKPQSKFELLFSSFNAHTILELLSKLLSKTVNLFVIEDCLSFISLLFQEISGFGQMLFLITQAIRFQLPKTFCLLLARIKTRELKSSHMIRYNLQCDLSELLGKSSIEPFKLKEMIKIQKSAEKAFNATLREVNRGVGMLNEDFERYKKGKIAFRKKKQVGSVVEEEIEEREILNIQKLAEESHLHYKSQEIISMELFRENQELIKVNRWLEERLKKNEAIVAELLTINQKDNLKAKLKHTPQVLTHNILSNPQPSVRFSQVFQRSVTDEKGLSEMHLKRTQSRQLLDGRSYRESQPMYASNRKSHPKYTLPPNSGDNILLQIPRIDIPRERERRNSFNSLKQIEISQTSLIFQEATNKINKTIQAAEKEAGNLPLLPPPPPPPPILGLPPIPSLTGLPVLPPPPPSLLLPPPPFGAFNLAPPVLMMPLLLPPPPLLPPAALLPQRGSGSLKDIQQRIQMKNIGWNALQHSKIKNSFWQNIAEPKIVLNQDELIKYFSKNDKNFTSPKPTTPQVRTILKADRIKNVQIIMRKLKINDSLFPLIQDAFRSYNDQYLSQQFLSGLLNLCPTSKEKGEYMQITLQGDNWTPADRFLAFLSRIDSLEEKINGILFKQEFQSIATSFFGKVEQFVAFFQDIKEDGFFQAFLEFLLAVGNFLNLGTHRGNARAFRIENIQKTYLLLAQDKQTSLFQYILDVMYQHDPSLFQWPSLNNRAPNIVPLSVLCQDYSYFQKKCAVVSQCILLSQEDPLDQSAPYFLPFYLKAREDISTMKNQLEFASILFRGVKEFYGDKLESEQMAKLIIDFRNRVNQWRTKQRGRNRDKN